MIREILVAAVVILLATVAIFQTPAYDQVGIASWYGPGFHGERTSSGEIFDMHEMTAAHKSLPFGTLVKVVDLETGRSVVVRINDRGPFIPGRIIDLSRAAGERLGIIRKGTARVGLKIVRWP